MAIQNIIKPSTSKRGPGRPPKNENASTAVSDQPKRGPGRPPKNENASTAVSDQPKRGPGRPPKEATGTTNDNDQPKRGPGRPPKQAPGAVDQPKRGPGRPPKNENASTAVSDQPKRGPGRPPKQAPGAVDQPKRGPGRPPKDASTPVASTKVTAESTSFTDMPLLDVLPPLRDVKTGATVLAPTMQQVEKTLTHFIRLQNTNRVDLAVEAARLMEYGQWDKLGATDAAAYFRDKHAYSPQAIHAMITPLRLLARVLGLKGEKLANTYRKQNFQRMLLLTRLAAEHGNTKAQLEKALELTAVDNNISSVEFERKLYQTLKLPLPDDEDAATRQRIEEANAPEKIRGFSIPRSDAQIVHTVHDILKKEERNAELPLGAAVSKACAFYAANRGAEITELPTVIDALEKAHGVRVLVVPRPDIDADGRKSLPVAEIYELDGKFFMHTSRAKLARACGVVVDRLKVLRVDLAPYLDSIGFTATPAQSMTPKAITDLKPEEVKAKVTALFTKLKVPKREILALSEGRTQLEVLTELLKRDADAAQNVQAALPSTQTDEDLDEDESEEGSDIADDPSDETENTTDADDFENLTDIDDLDADGEVIDEVDE